MIELHQYPAIWGLPSLSPFCIKVEAFLRQQDIPYRVVVEKNPAHGPKGKMPFIRDGSKIIADSSFILQYLSQSRKQSDIYRPDANAKAQGLAFQRMVEEYLYFILLHSRWIDPVGWAAVSKDFSALFPPLLGTPFLRLIRHNLKRQAFHQGIGRHSREEVYQIARQEIDALSLFLDKKPYFLGDRWSITDATIYAFLITILKQPIESGLKTALLSRRNLVSYCRREEQSLFPEFCSAKVKL